MAGNRPVRVGPENRFSKKQRVRKNNFESIIALGVATEPQHPRVQAVDTASDVVFQCLMCSFLRA